MNILLINAEDFGGGANKIATSLLNSYKSAGHRVKLLVREKNNNNPDIISVPNEESRNLLYRLINRSKINTLSNGIKFIPKVLQTLELVSEPLRNFKFYLGLEDFDFPGCAQLLGKLNFSPDIIHCHNLHSNFFDLRLLIKLSNSVPTFITLHDCWMLTGHCVHPYECKKWKKVCYKCPYPKRPIRTKRDASFLNQWRKERIYQKSKLHISAPSDWLRSMSEESILNKGAVEFKTIPNGIDKTIFNPGCKIRARTEIGLCQKKKIILFAGGSVSKNQAKGWNNLLNLLYYTKNKKSFPKTVILILGDSIKEKIYGNITLKSISWVSSDKELVNYYRSSDLYLHLANAENFPLSILEAMHCGIPVVASNVGGIPEQIVHTKTGFIVDSHDSAKVAQIIKRILTEDVLHSTLSSNAHTHALKYFEQNMMTNSYLAWFENVLKSAKDY